jgi:peptidoglycan/xylan/chitin deacetylase (PgdA/CDA1 family)
MMSLPILTYHAVETPEGSEALPANRLLYLIKADLFTAQMGYLAGQGFCTLTVEDVISASHGGRPLPDRALCLTFDDGSASDYYVAFPILKQFGLKATFFIVTGWVGTPGYVTWEQLQEMSGQGMSIQSHSHTHPFMSRCTASELAIELSQSKRILEAYLPRAVEVFAAPGGDWNESCRLVAREAGYRAVCTSRAGINAGQLQLEGLERLSVRRSDRFEQFVSFVTRDHGALLKYRVKESALFLAKRSLGLSRYNRLRTWLLN